MTDTPIKDRAERLIASRRWTHGDLDLLQVLLDAGEVRHAETIGEDAGRIRSLRSLTTLGLATVDGAVVRMGEDAKAVAALVLEWHVRRKARADARNERHAGARDEGEDLKRTLAAAVRTVFPAIPEEVALAAATRLAPGVAKLRGKRPGMQSLVDVVAEIRVARWRQAVAAEPAVAQRLEDMQTRGDNNRARKRYRDQRAADRTAAELEAWRGDLGPVTSKWLGR